MAVFANTIDLSHLIICKDMHYVDSLLGYWRGLVNASPACCRLNCDQRSTIFEVGKREITVFTLSIDTSDFSCKGMTATYTKKKDTAALQKNCFIQMSNSLISKV